MLRKNHSIKNRMETVFNLIENIYTKEESSNERSLQSLQKQIAHYVRHFCRIGMLNQIY